MDMDCTFKKNKKKQTKTNKKTRKGSSMHALGACAKIPGETVPACM